MDYDSIHEALGEAKNCLDDASQCIDGVDGRDAIVEIYRIQAAISDLITKLEYQEELDKRLEFLNEGS